MHGRRPDKLAAPCVRGFHENVMKGEQSNEPFQIGTKCFRGRRIVFRPRNHFEERHWATYTPSKKKSVLNVRAREICNHHYRAQPVEYDNYHRDCPGSNTFLIVFGMFAIVFYTVYPDIIEIHDDRYE